MGSQYQYYSSIIVFGHFGGSAIVVLYQRYLQYLFQLFSSSDLLSRRVRNIACFSILCLYDDLILIHAMLQFQIHR